MLADISRNYDEIKDNGKNCFMLKTTIIFENKNIFARCLLNKLFYIISQYQGTVLLGIYQLSSAIQQ